ncbi:Holliday junction resolvase RuvX [Methylophaga pinxianii]|uniref:Holliday junction resolvase RuvX n=1 Tax=Methylophaga pinxianii TaxID=2881052 RepID=UPI001CF1C450|nr:Holliday junction resolvase RuvX [Methylophaga pinxianii]MCB2427099.1 Holliday junction resolvase RuvX [Methylophaga pinxianii]UPH46003.1 Holliday junction resolvase RuvX [Methylophaga pinxianii]
MSSEKNILGFDFGMKSIGVAVGHQLTNTARGIEALTARDGIPDWEVIAKIVAEWQPGLIVVGLPLNMDGTEQLMTAAARKFGNRMNNRFNIPVVWQDERLTTFEALDQMGIRSKMQSDKRSDVDKLSAQIILQSWLDLQ